jgi:hypothetical protein
MNRITGAIKATYNFFSGDAIILSAVIVAFVLGIILAQAVKAPNVVVALLFVAIIVASLVATLSRELVGRKRS